MEITEEKLEKARLEHPDCIVGSGHGCIFLYPKFD
jgi:hypothetical protein